jgi:photosystem II stability/assembly factor-like uncharacterized protein
MRARLLLVAAAVSAVAAGLAGCATAPASVPAGGQATATAASAVPSASPAGSSATPAATTSPAGSAAGPSSPSSSAGSSGAGCGAPPAPIPAGEELTGVQFVSPSHGWAVGRGAILATADGGAHWRVQLAGRLDLTAVDFINTSDGWAVGTGSLLATTDGGARWTPLAEPCPLIRSVHFTSATDGYAVAGGGAATVRGFATGVPDTGGVVLVTHDGGRTWAKVTAPGNAQTVCFSGRGNGWLGANGQLYRTGNGGTSWTALTSPPSADEAGYVATMSVQCAGQDAAWAVRAGPGAGMSQQPHVAFHADASGVTAVYAEQYYRLHGDPATNSPGAYAGPFSALTPSAAVFIDSCAPCGAGTAPWAVATSSGTALARHGDVGGLTFADAAAFLTPETGWVTGTYSEYPAKGGSRYQARLMATTDGGKTWHTQWASPWYYGTAQ